MTATFDFDRLLGSVLEEGGPHSLPDTVVEAALIQARGLPQRRPPVGLLDRRAWPPPRFWLSDPSLMRLATLGLVIVLTLALIAAAVVAIGSIRRPPEPFGAARNGSVAYSLGGDIVLADPTSGATRIVVADPAFDHDPIFSPDGTRLVFWRPSSQLAGDDLVVTKADGSDPITITHGPLVEPSWIDWAPDGRTVVVASSVDGQPTLQLLDAGGGAGRTLVDGMAVHSAVFRPLHGAEILFRGQTRDSVGLYVMNADGSNRRTLVAPTTDDIDHNLGSPRYSPDGSTIAYHRWDSVLREYRLHVMAADGTDDRVLTHDPRAWFEGWPVWSPDGTRIAIQRMFRGVSGELSREVRPYAIIRADGTGEAIETGPPLPEGGGRIDWSPDGTKLFMEPASGVSPPLILDPDGGPWTATSWSTTSIPSWQRLAP